MPNLEGKTAVITGGTREIGFGIAVELAHEGATILINHRSGKSSSNLQDKLTGGHFKSGFILCEADMTIEEDVIRLAETAKSELKRIDIWVNNVGLHIVSPGLSQTKANWDELFSLNATSTFLGCREAARVMKENGGGSIINVSSKMGLVGSPENACYCSSKAAVIMMTRCFGAEWAPYNIRVNAVTPGVTWTDPTFKIVDGNPELKASLHYRTPMHRFAQPEEIGKVVAFLASDAASYITGETIVCDGGWIANSDFSGIPPSNIERWKDEFDHR
jgi:3-oxoacyl-[acyl-carrier protein] reductase